MSLKGACEWVSRPLIEWKAIPALSTDLPVVGERGVEDPGAGKTRKFLRASYYASTRTDLRVDTPRVKKSPLFGELLDFYLAPLDSS